MVRMILRHLRLKKDHLISFSIHSVDFSPDSRPFAGCSRLATWWVRLCPKRLWVSLILSEQGGTTPPCLQSRDRLSLDYQAGKRHTADCLALSVSSVAQGNACQC